MHYIQLMKKKKRHEHQQYVKKKKINADFYTRM